MLLTLGARIVDLDARTVVDPRPAEATTVGLSPSEVLLLRRLVDARAEPVPVETLRALVGAASDNAFARSLVRLRGKVEDDPKAPLHLLTLRGEGLLLRWAPPRAVEEALPESPGRWMARPLLRARLDAALAVPGLVTLLGAGGAGKTTLAGSVAADWPQAWFCDLVPARTADDVWRIVAGATAEPVPGDLPSVRALGRALARRGAGLLVLDNAEQVVAEVAALVAVMAAEAPALRLLVTSRLPLGSPVERRIEVSTLEPAEAEALFALRAGAPPEPSVRALLDEVERLPLVVELLATQARALGPGTLREVFRADPLALTTTPDAPERQLTLGHTLAWSFGLLTPAQRDALVRLSVVSASLPLGLAEALVGERALDRLQALRDAGLVVARQGRVGLLELVRRFAASRLDAGVREAAFADGLAWAVRFVAQRPSETGGQQIGRVRAEVSALWELLRSGLPGDRTLAATLVPLRVFGTAQQRWVCDLALADGGGAARVSLLVARAEAARYSGDEPTALRDLDEALGLDPEPRWRGRLLVERGNLRRQRGDYDGAERDLREASGLEPDVGRVTYALASLLTYQGRVGESASLVRSREAAFEGSPYALPLRSLMAQAEGRIAPEAALEAFEALRPLARGDIVRLAFLDAYQAEIHAGAGALGEAQRLYASAARTLASRQHLLPLGEVEAKRAWVEHRLGDTTRAEALLAGLRTGEGYLHRLGTAWTALVWADTGRATEARRCLDTAPGDGAPWSLLSVLARSAEALLARAEGDGAPLEALRRAATERPWLVLPPGL